MVLRELLRAEMLFVYADIFRRKSILVMYLLYPYILTMFIVLLGSSIGSYQAFKYRLGIDPIPFFLTASYLVMSILAVSDDILWKPIHDRMLGVLPYILITHVRKIAYFAIIPIPRLILVLVLGCFVLPPVYVMFYGIEGFYLTFEVVSLALLSSILFITFSILLVGVLYSLGGESWRVLNIIRPLLMIFLGIYYPRFLMPTMMFLISSILPPSYIIELMYRSLLRIATEYSYVLELLGIAIAISLIYAPLSSKAIATWERKKVREGVEV